MDNNNQHQRKHHDKTKGNNKSVLLITHNGSESIMKRIYLYMSGNYLKKWGYHYYTQKTNTPKIAQKIYTETYTTTTTQPQTEDSAT